MSTPPTTTATKRSGRTRWITGFLQRVFRHRSRNPAKIGIEAMFISFFLFLTSGYIRGPAPDQFVRVLAYSADQYMTNLITEHDLLHPIIAIGVIRSIELAMVAITVLILAWLFHKLPGFIGSLLISELHRRQGNTIDGFFVLAGIAMPVYLTLCVVCYSVVSLYAAASFVFTYVMIRFARDPARMDTVLNFYAKFRTPLMDDPSSFDNPDDSLFE